MGNDVHGASTSTEGHQTSEARGVKVPRIAYTLSIALAFVTIVAAGLSAFGDVLRGPDVMKGSARGPESSSCSSPSRSFQQRCG